MKGALYFFSSLYDWLISSKAILQRVTSASVTVDKQLVSFIGRGILVFAAVDRDDTRKEVEAMAGKVLKLKMWPDEGGGTVSVPIINFAWLF